MVCFTSPNYSWLDGTEKAANHIPLHLPVWTLQELWEANELLELGIDYGTIEGRFLFFGGSARYCLTLDDLFHNRGVDKLRNKSKSIATFDAIKECLDEKAEKSDISHRIFILLFELALSLGISESRRLLLRRVESAFITTSQVVRIYSHF